MAELAKTSRTDLAQQRACLCARVAQEHRGRNIVVLDLHRVTPWLDFFVLATGTSRRQMCTMADEVDRAMTALGERRLGIEGYESGRWILLDYGDFVVHLFNEDTRGFYDLEHLWADASRVPWEQDRVG